MSKSITHPNWNPAARGISVCWPQTCESNTPTEKIFDSLETFVEMDGKALAFNVWSMKGENCAMAESGGILLEVEITKKTSIVAHVVNQSNTTRKLDKLIFRPAMSAKGTDILSIAGSRLRIFRDGWTMASPAASVRLGESDFKMNPDYKPFASSAPGEYCDSEPNRFSGEYVAVLNDALSGMSTLVGFITSANQVTRIAVAIDNTGISSLEAIAYCDGLELAPGDEVYSEELVIMAGADGYGLLEEFASLWGKAMKALTWSHVPTGWCSWYYYFDKITELDMLENVAWLKEHNEEFPLEYIQMDDGYQSALGDWLVCDKVKFPNGLHFLANEIKVAGFKPGLWLAPFMVEEGSTLFQAHPDWMIKNRSGETVWVTTWRGARVAALDCTVPAATDWLTETFSALVDMGFDYVKLDFLMYACGAIALGGVYADRKATRVQALRKGLQAIRKGMGNRFILGCTSPLGPEVGLVNGARIGTDITPYWQDGEGKPYKEAPCVPNVCRNIINRSYMHGRLWINDPDTHIARIDNNKLTEDEVILWTSALWLVGGMLLLSDRFCTLTPERAKLSKLLLREVGHFEAARPLDIFEREYPAVWLAKSTSQPGEFTVGVFNFEDCAQTINVNLDAAREAKDHQWDVREVWTNKNLGAISDAFEVQLKPHSCKIFVLKPQ